MTNRGYSVINSVVLMFVRGWQGGTIHQIAAELGVTVQDIQTANIDRMGELMRMAQAKQRTARADAKLADVVLGMKPND